MRRLGLALVGILLAGCSIPLAPTARPRAKIDCGPLSNNADCARAIAAARTSLPPDASEPTDIVVRFAVPSDACAHWFHACGSSDIVVSFGLLRNWVDVPLIRTADSWIPLVLIR